MCSDMNSRFSGFTWLGRLNLPTQKGKPTAGNVRFPAIGNRIINRKIRVSE